MSNTTLGQRSTRSRKPAIMFFMSLILGGTAVFFSRQYIEEQISHYRAQLEKTEPMASVIVPVRALRRGEVVRKEDLVTRPIPTQYVDSNSIQMEKLDTALGQVLDFDIDRGTPLLWAHLEGGLTPTFSGKVVDGLRALTIRVDEINSISGFLQPTDRVDLLLIHGRNDEQSIVPLIEQLEVIATGTQTLVDKAGSASTNGRRQFTTITVQVSPHQAQQLTLAQEIGKVTATLRHPDDESPLGNHQMTVAELLGTVEPEAPPEVVKQPVRRRASGPTIEYIIGGS